MGRLPHHDEGGELQHTDPEPGARAKLRPAVAQFRPHRWAGDRIARCGTESQTTDGSRRGPGVATGAGRGARSRCPSVGFSTVETSMAASCAPATSGWVWRWRYMKTGSPLRFSSYAARVAPASTGVTSSRKRRLAESCASAWSTARSSGLSPTTSVTSAPPAQSPSRGGRLRDSFGHRRSRRGRAPRSTRP